MSKPNKKHSNNAERQKAYRERRKAAGSRAPSGKSGRSNATKSKWEIGQFIGLDGEGESIVPLQSFSVGTEGKTYHAKEHIYTLLAASSGESLYNGGKRLSSQSCIDYLLDLSDAHKKAIFVIFAGSYDTNHILMFGFPRDQLQRISRGELFEYEHGGEHYQIEYRARKSLTLRRGLSWRTDAKNKMHPVWKSKINIWDVWGFFQDSFVVVIEKWLGKEWRHYQLIKEMKLLRGDFASIEQHKINAYNAAELETLVAIMDKVREAINGLGLKCYRWDGAGAIAAALMRKHKVTEFKAPINETISEAVRCAYAGGRIEVCKIGNHSGPVYDYDINSAYPTVQHKLPCMLHGVWKSGKTANPPKGFTLVHVKFEFADDLPFYPLFYRTDKMQISFPQSGEGWYWWPEYEAALDCPGVVEVLGWHHFEQQCNHEPFHWVETYYETRQQWTKHATEEWQKGGEKIIKLGLNSLYGKTAQQLGGRADKPPAYHQLEWAGFITSSTRARLYRAANLNPDSVIGFATDGIFTTEQLPIECSTTKAMGAWELKEPVPQGMTIAMAGVYWWHLPDDKFTHFSRGFDKDSMKTPDRILNAWKEGKTEIDIPMHRLIGMGSACASESLWPMRGRFTEGLRTLRLDGKSHKRLPIDVRRSKPHLQLVDLQPSLNVEYLSGIQGCSHPYPVIWLEGNLTDDYESDLELQRENSDTENI